MANPEFITIKDKTYKVADLSEQAIELANKIQTIQNVIANKQTEIGICEVASDSIIAQLIDVTSTLTPIEEEVK